jgi:hypothetical protein
MYALPYLAFVRLHQFALDARRRDRTWRYFAWSLVAGTVGGLLVGVALFMAWALWIVGWWHLALAVIFVAGMPIAHPIVQRHVLVPLGAVRTAHWCGHFVAMRDSDALGMACGAWALAGRYTLRGEAWLARRRDRRQPLGDAEIVVTAFIAAARGDANTARQLLRSLDQIVELHPQVRELAGEWLACDAARRGAWDEIAIAAQTARYPATSLTYFLEAVAARRTSASAAPGTRELIGRWLLAPHRRATRSLLRSPPAVSARPTVGDTAEAGVIADTPSAALPRAVAAHLAIAHATPGQRRVDEAAHAWDVALADPEVHKWLARRALELEAPLGAVDRTLREVATSVGDELARVAEQEGLGGCSSRGLVGEAIARKLRHGRLDALETGFARWVERRHSGSVRAAIDEWREWCALRDAYDKAVAAGGIELRRLAFPHAYTTGTQMAAWFWNSRKEYALSHAISKWLLDEALAVGDTEAIDLCTRNARLAVHTRTGVIHT